MTTLDQVKVLKVKRKHREDSLPDLLVLDRLIDTKRQKTVMRIYERVRLQEDQEELFLEAPKLPLAQIRPSPSEVFSTLRVTEDDESGRTEEASSSADEERFDYYMLQDDDSLLQSIDLTDLCRIHLPDHGIIFLDNSASEDANSAYSDDDSNAEDYYQNDYPDEDEDEDYTDGDGDDDDADDDIDDSSYQRRYRSTEDLSYDEEYEYVGSRQEFAFTFAEDSDDES